MASLRPRPEPRSSICTLTTPPRGRQRDDYDIYAPIIEGIRAKVDAIVYPTLPITGSGYAGELRSAQERYAHVERLAKNGLLEWAVIDPGSAVFTRFDEIARGEAGYTYFNPDDHFREGMRIAAAYGVRPSYAIYEAGCTRLGAATAAAIPKVPTPVYRFMFAEEFCFGFPPKPAYLDAHLALLAETAPGAPWMVAGLGLDIRPLIAPAVARGGHVRVGLEDRPWGARETNRGARGRSRETRARGWRRAGDRRRGAGSLHGCGRGAATRQCLLSRVSMTDSEKNRFSARARRYAKVGTRVGGVAARIATSRALGRRQDRGGNALALAAALGGLKGPIMKVAQLLATIPDALPPEYANELIKLQSQAPPMGWAFVKRRMQAELGAGWEKKFETLRASPGGGRLARPGAQGARARRL